MKILSQILLRAIILSALLPANFMLFIAVIKGWNIFRNGAFFVILGCIIGIGGYVGLLLSLLLPTERKMGLKIGLLLCGLLGFQIYLLSTLPYDWSPYSPVFETGRWFLLAWPNYAALFLAIYFSYRWFLKRKRKVQDFNTH